MRDDLCGLTTLPAIAPIYILSTDKKYYYIF